jgi:reactive intermediate/imine deaminase
MPARLFLIILSTLATACATARDPRIVRYVSPENAARNVPYSDAVRAGNHVFVSGKMGIAPGERDPVPGGVEAETRQALENIRSALEASGATLADVVKCTVILADIGDWEAMNSVYRTFFPGGKPARTTFGSAGLVRKGRVEIDCTAVVE